MAILLTNDMEKRKLITLSPWCSTVRILCLWRSWQSCHQVRRKRWYSDESMDSLMVTTWFTKGTLIEGKESWESFVKILLQGRSLHGVVQASTLVIEERVWARCKCKYINLWVGYSRRQNVHGLHNNISKEKRWILDLGGVVHVCSQKKKFYSLLKERTIRVTNGKACRIVGNVVKKWSRQLLKHDDLQGTLIK